MTARQEPQRDLRADEALEAHVKLVRLETELPELRDRLLWALMRISALARFEAELNGGAA